MTGSMLPELLETFPREEFDELVAVRRDLHRNPELGFAETRTAGIAESRARALGFSPAMGVGRTGVVVDAGAGGGRLLIRADMDALPLQEETGAAYASQTPGRMHACGHDGHVAMGLAVLARLAARPPGGPFRSLFQPAEEGPGGAEATVADGALEGVAGALGVHLWNELPVGRVGLFAGPQMAAVDEFEIVVTGPGGHAAKPHQSPDTVLAAARIVEALQSVVSREISPMDPAVVTVASIHGGSAFNVVPREVRLLGTARSFSAEVHAALPEKIRRIVSGLAGAAGVQASLEYRRINRATVNDRVISGLVAAVCEELLGPGSVVETRTMGGEDMSVFLDRVPGCFFFVGSALPGPLRAHHSPVFDFDERALAVGTVLLEEAARRFSRQLAAV
jgi:amidohydrolase